MKRRMHKQKLMKDKGWFRDGRKKLKNGKKV